MTESKGTEKDLSVRNCETPKAGNTIPAHDGVTAISRNLQFPVAFKAHIM